MRSCRRAGGRGDDWSLDICPEEGAAVFGRLLDRSLAEPQVLISVRNFAVVLSRMEV